MAAMIPMMIVTTINSTSVKPLGRAASGPTDLRQRVQAPGLWSLDLGLG